jgi:hypothetical protein
MLKRMISASGISGQSIYVRLHGQCPMLQRWHQQARMMRPGPSPSSSCAESESPPAHFGMDADRVPVDSWMVGDRHRSSMPWPVDLIRFGWPLVSPTCCHARSSIIK